MFRAKYGLILDYNLFQMHMLLKKSVEYVHGTPTEEIQYLVRCKSYVYYFNVQQSEDGVEKPYLKDKSGDEACPINGNFESDFQI